METKKCNNCHNIFPKTKDYFFIKITKKDSKTGIRLKLKNDSYSFRHNCKKCSNQINTLRQQKKKAIQYGVSLEYYQQNSKNYTIIAVSKPKLHPEFTHMPNRSKEKRDAIKLKKLGITP